jgi:GNAT superfamily N-acetyltransferase
VGVITVSTSAAIYAAGIVGTIQELYVVPALRSAAVGATLLSTVVEVGRASGWNRLEVGAPSQERWKRTIDFYEANGFTEIGPRLGRRLTT